MRRPPSALAALALVSFTAGCMQNLPHPVPPPAERDGLNVRGVVVGEPATGERVEFREVNNVQWTDSTVAITGFLSGSPGDVEYVTRTHRLSDLGALLVRQVDPNRTSILIGGVIVGTIAVIALLVTGQADEDTRLEPIG